MKRFLSAVCLCLTLLVSGLFFFLPKSEAQNDILPALLRLPAPPPPNPLVENGRRNRPQEFYSKKNPPGDDAPIEDLLDYWKHQSDSFRELGYNLVLKGKSLDRILAEIEKDHELLSDYIRAFPESADVADFVKEIYDRHSGDKDFEEGWHEQVENWLMYHSKYFSDQLLKLARETGDSNEYVTDQEPFLALARVDWEKARPLVDRLYNDSSQPVSQVLARWAYYLHALDTDSIGDIDRYRDELKAMVENKNATAGMRDLAFDALVKEKQWDGLYDWYLTLLEDETLAELKVDGTTYTGLTTLMYYVPPETYVERMIKLLKSDNPAVRTAVIRNLAKILSDEPIPDIIQALLPWLEDPKWATEIRGERRVLISALQKITLPESVPGLIAMLNEKEKREILLPSSNTSTTNTATVKTVEEDSYPYRREAITALAKQKDVRAAPALRKLLPSASEYEIEGIVSALLASNGFTVAEQIEALEIVAESMKITNYQLTANSMIRSGNVTQGRIMLANMDMVPRVSLDIANTGNFRAWVNGGSKDITAILGLQIINNPEPSAALVTAVVERIGVLDGKDAKLAGALRQIVKTWKGTAINSLLLRDVRTGRADLNSIVKLLTERKNLREKQLNEIYDVRGAENRTAYGISACLLDNSSEYEAILRDENPEIKTAMLACARMIRAKLPIGKVAENLKSANKQLALAAELYLESEDSPEAREIVLSLHPNEAKILGARLAFETEDTIVIDNYTAELFATVGDSFTFGNSYFTGSYFGELDEVAERLKKEVRENENLLGVYAYDKHFIRIYKDKVVFSWQENEARYRERDLSEEEFEDIKNYLVENRVYELPPFLYSCDDECEEKELVMLGRQGGRRVFVRAERMPAFFAGLNDRFERLRITPAKLRYELEKDLAGLDILFVDEVLEARAVWKNGDDFRVLIEDTERGKRVEKELELATEADEENESLTYDQREEREMKRGEQRAYEHLSWFKFDKGKLTALADQPLIVSYIPPRDGFPVPATKHQWRAKTGNIEIRANSEGLYKISGAAFTKIRSGNYVRPLLTVNGRWVIVSKYNEEEDERHLVRINLQTNKEFPIEVPDLPAVDSVTVIASTNKVLIAAGDYDYGSASYTYFLLNPDNGVLQPVSGEMRPLIQPTFRGLQTTGVTDEFWAAIPDSKENETLIGTYNLKDLSFKPVLKIPRIKFDSMDTWIDGGKVYFVYEGHLLSIPLAKSAQ